MVGLTSRVYIVFTKWKPRCFGAWCLLFLDTKALVICCIYGIILPSYVGIRISHYKDPYQQTSTMECHWWVLITVHLKKQDFCWFNSSAFYLFCEKSVLFDFWVFNSFLPCTKFQMWIFFIFSQEWETNSLEIFVGRWLGSGWKPCIFCN